METEPTPLHLDEATQSNLLDALAGAKGEPGDRERRRRSRGQTAGRIEDVAGYRQVRLQREVADCAGIGNPFFLCHESRAADVTRIDGRDFLNFSTYDYLGLNGHPAVARAATAALQRYGTSASASRLVSGERPPHRELEAALAEMAGAEACLTFVSGHATNVNLLTHLFSARDLIVHDALAHNSLILGAQFARAARFAFPHNDMAALERCLEENRGRHERALIVTEGLFSMDGSVAPLPELAAIKRRHGCFLMIDDAHGVGVLGERGRGSLEHFGCPASDVDVYMGTLSKTLCGCGGFVCGSAGLIDYLRFSAPGFVYSVGMSPVLAAASRAALAAMLAEPGRVARLRALGRHFLETARRLGLDTGHSVGVGIIPVMVGNSLAAGYLADALFRRGVNVQPIIHPVVEEGRARLRFFLSAAHREEQIDQALAWVAEELPGARTRAEALVDQASQALAPR